MQDNGSPGQLQADGFSGISALAFDSNTNTLYGVAATADQLVIINTSTGQATGVGTPGLLSFGSVGGIAFDPESNILYGVDSSADMLLQINTSTGIGSGIGSPGSLSPFRNATGLAIKTPIIPPTSDGTDRVPLGVIQVHRAGVQPGRQGVDWCTDCTGFRTA